MQYGGAVTQLAELGREAAECKSIPEFTKRISPLAFPHILPSHSTPYDMAPTPRPMSDPILLELTLVSPPKLTNDVLREIKRLARLTTALTILVHTPPPHPDRPITTSAPRSAERHFENLDWDQFQAIVVGIYTAATKVYLEENRPLSVVDVLFDSIRNGGKLAGSWVGTVYYSQRVSGNTTSTEEVVDGAGNGGSEFRGQALFEVTALGGTFDHLHAGHKILLTMSAWITTKRLIVGITGQFDLLSFLAEISHCFLRLRTSNEK